jgi:hypothetical protein
VLEFLAVDIFALEIPAPDTALVPRVHLFTLAPEIARGLLLEGDRVG